MFVRAWGSNEVASFDTAIDTIILFCHLNREMMFLRYRKTKSLNIPFDVEFHQ